ncbi:hypothetical protein KJS94_01410 [Flavihumibacter rivuli]|uniref:hypothetical protein n=1 Tax=Flavihumibacter rivuli TaxID=2838156 RepID=UPI001BDED381|nr:hypothetical protein [Flavihumibacter rivuli]ULQ56853.1 hypothetical protein KJS94_01410 [Flavihumibacter rivuli]
MRFLFVVVLASVLFACSKSKEVAGKESLAGSWLLSSYYESTGAAGEWKPANSLPNRRLELRADGTMAGDLIILNRFETYTTRQDSLVFYGAARQDSLVMPYELESNILMLYPLCYEGCGLKFRRVLP